MTPCEEMKMNVEYRLAGAGIIVIDYPEPFFSNSVLPRYQGGHLKDMADEGIVLRVEIHSIYEMFPGNEQDVGRCNRRDILDGNDLFILINFLCGYFSLDDLAENTVAQTNPPLADSISLSICTGFKAVSATVSLRAS